MGQDLWKSQISILLIGNLFPSTVWMKWDSETSLVPYSWTSTNDGDYKIVYSPVNCGRMITLKDSVDGIALGSTSVSEDISCTPFSWPVTNGQLYINRQYKISPANKGRAEICLYFLQEDFNNYNLAAASHVPAFPPINPLSNLCITEVFNGTIDSPNCVKRIIPNSSLSVSYDSASTIWQVCFPVDSLGNYYAHTVNPLNVSLNLTCYIQGYWNGANAMLPVLTNQFVPTTTSACDTITIELHTTHPPYKLVSSTKVLLNQNGTAICNLQIQGSVGGNYYLAVKHRNGLETWSKFPLSIGNSPLIYNFTSAASKAFGDNQIQVGSGIWAFYSGDINQDENIDLLDLGEIENDINSFSSGYYATDINGDGNVDLLDSPIVETNINDFVFSVHP